MIQIGAICYANMIVNNKFDGHATCVVCGEWKPFMFMHEKIRKSKELATRAHEGQLRKYESLPYIKHPEI